MRESIFMGNAQSDLICDTEEKLRQMHSQAQAAGVDPCAAPALISDTAQRAARQRIHPLLVHSQAVATSIFRMGPDVTTIPWAALMFDAEGILVKVYAGKNAVSWLEEHQVRRWTRWSAEALGPNIFSLGITQRQVVRMEGKDCYARCLQGVTWYFHTMPRADNSVWGGIAVACPEEYDSPLFYYLTTALYAGIHVNTNWFHMMEYCTSGTEGMGFMVIDYTGGKKRLITVGDEGFQNPGPSKTGLLLSTAGPLFRTQAGERRVLAHCGKPTEGQRSDYYRHLRREENRCVRKLH